MTKGKRENEMDTGIGDLGLVTIAACDAAIIMGRGNPALAGIVKLAEGRRAVLQAQAAAAKAKEEFSAKLLNTLQLGPPPEGVYNVYLAWQEVEEEDREHGEPVKVPKLDEAGNPVLSKSGNPVMVEELRFPRTKVRRWVATANKGFNTQTKATAATETTKRGIRVSRRNDQDVVVEVGRYRSGHAACKALGLDEGVGSANAFLARQGYLVETYTGVDFTG